LRALRSRLQHDAGERYGTLRRVVNRYNHEVNGYFLCDRGRFGYEFVNSERRLLQPVLDGQPVSRRKPASICARRSRTGKVIGIGSPRASLEANFALRTLVGPDRFHSGMADDEARLVGG
jgi:NADH-quinone oxidoreductase subunit G